jgi:penicillin-binding protein 2
MRGRRGRVHKDADGQALAPPVEPVDGRTFRLTLDARLQKAFYARLAKAVEATEYQTGACAVLIHAPTRQVLAMVDYPSIDPAASLTARGEAAADLRRRPLLARAIRAYYPPGSVVKPLLLLAALAEGVVQPDTHFTCYGHLFPDLPDAWRCTGRHGTIGPVFAIQHSCNVYFYNVGERMGGDRIRGWFERFGFGRLSGTNLVGELPGRLPEHRTKGQARNSAIGQAFDVTPIQIANMTATLATGRYQPVRLWLDDPEVPEAVPLPAPRAAWHLVREGMYEVVNRAGGTAYGQERAMLEGRDHVLLGKTGSAEVVQGRTVAWKFYCHLPDGRVQEIIAPDRESALAKADCPPEQRRQITITGRRSYHRYPPDTQDPYTHAWFTGYLAPRQGYLRDVRDDPRAVAIAVVIEYAGHGGDVAAPVARDMLQIFLDEQGGPAQSAKARHEEADVMSGGPHT